TRAARAARHHPSNVRLTASGPPGYGWDAAEIHGDRGRIPLTTDAYGARGWTHSGAKGATAEWGIAARDAGWIWTAGAVGSPRRLRRARGLLLGARVLLCRCGRFLAQLLLHPLLGGGVEGDRCGAQRLEIDLAHDVAHAGELLLLLVQDVEDRRHHLRVHV